MPSLLAAHRKATGPAIADGQDAQDATSQEDREPAVIRNWCGEGGTPVLRTGDIYTPVALGADGRSYVDIEGEPAWAPLTLLPEKAPPQTRANEVPPSGVLIGSRDGRALIKVAKLIGHGAHGAVFQGDRLMRTGPPSSSGLALKFMMLNPQQFASTSPKRLLPGAVKGVFAQYIAQHAFGGCMPHTVCMYDAFMYATPGPGGDSVQWYAVLATEMMEGNVVDLVASPDFRGMTAAARLPVVADIARQMVKAVYDLEMQRIYHDDIKLSNFLYKKRSCCLSASSASASASGTSSHKYEIKITDFDQSSFASRTNDVAEPMLVTTQIIKDSTRGQLDRDAEPWALDPGTRHLLLAELATDGTHRPPEYDTVGSVLRSIHSGEPHADPRLQALIEAEFKETEPHTGVPPLLKCRMATVYNADWLSRMMAFELACSVRELFIVAGFAMFYDPVGGTYPAEITNPQGSSTHRRPSTLVRMAPDGPQSIVPAMPAYSSADRLRLWRGLTRGTVIVDGLRSAHAPPVMALNALLAQIIAPATPSAERPSADFPLTLAAVSGGLPEELLCTGGMDPADCRPTVAELLKFLSEKCAELKK